MKINEEQGKRIRELEEELSDERLVEIFSEASADGIQIGGRRRKPLRRKVFVVFICVVCIVVLAQFFAPAVIVDRSMEPELAAWDCVLIAKMQYVFGEVRYRDIVVLNAGRTGPDETKRNEYKRVIGLPGDHIEMRDGGIYRNGERLSGVYGSGSAQDVSAPVTVPDRRYFVMSDNRGGWDPNLSLVAKEEMRGQVIFRLLPASKTGRID
jgi:signal peptidase I